MKRIFSQFAYSDEPRQGCWWDKTVEIDENPRLQGDVTCDVVVRLSVEVELTDGRWILSTDRPTGHGVVGIRTDIRGVGDRHQPASSGSDYGRWWL